MASRAYLLSLLFLILRATRGGVGVAVVSAFTQQNWAVFSQDFDEYCELLVSHCEEVCEGRGDPVYLAHREGLHAMLSGIHFIRTLARVSLRRRLLELARVFEPVVERMLRGRGHVSLTVEDVTTLGEAYQGGIVLAVQGGDLKYAAGYNAMDALRCFMAVCEHVFGVAAAVYDDAMHAWFDSRQSRKYRRQGALLRRCARRTKTCV